MFKKIQKLLKKKPRYYTVVNNGHTRRTLSAKDPHFKKMRRLFGASWKPILQ